MARIQDRHDGEALTALQPRGSGHQFVVYGDSCSGQPDGRHAATFAATNQIIQRLVPDPEWVIFLGDEIAGLTQDEDELRRQWRHWLDVEMGWLDRARVPLYHTTSNHTTYGEMSERVFAEVLTHLPRNGPEQQKGLSYFVRRGDVLMVFIHTCWSGAGGEGHAETAWLAEILAAHDDARFKLVAGHHPVFPVNGFSGPGQRTLWPETGAEIWRLLVQHHVRAYLCSHILAFDVQVHDGVLQILTAGAGTAHRMPEEQEYLHCVQMAIDAEGLRYQVLDHQAKVRERLRWPIPLPPSDSWDLLVPGHQQAPVPAIGSAGLTAWEISGRLSGETASAQTFISARQHDRALPVLWIGVTGRSRRLTVTLAPWPGRSPHYWFGPELKESADFGLQIAIHTGMGPGGILFRQDDEGAWTSLQAASPWGAECLPACVHWYVAGGDKAPENQSFCGQSLAVRCHSRTEL